VQILDEDQEGRRLSRLHDLVDDGLSLRQDSPHGRGREPQCALPPRKRLIGQPLALLHEDCPPVPCLRLCGELKQQPALAEASWSFEDDAASSVENHRQEAELSSTTNKGRPCHATDDSGGHQVSTCGTYSPDVAAHPFPDVRWGREGSRVGQGAARFAATRPGSWLLRTLTPMDRRLLIRSRGRYTVLGPIGAPTMLLTTIGSRSGLRRTSPLLYHREPARLFVVGSNFGQARHPAWSGNLLADPRATVTIGGRDVRVRATLLEGPERERIWQAFVDLARTYDAYRERTERDIRVFALDPV